MENTTNGTALITRANTDKIEGDVNAILQESARLQKETLIPALQELDKMAKSFNAHMFDGKLPAVVITIQSKGKIPCSGWFTPAMTWHNTDGKAMHEINICAESLSDVDKVAETVLHEMVHLYCNENDIKDCSRNGYYHNEKFRSAAESHGLICGAKDTKYGYGFTSLTTEIKAWIDSQSFNKILLQRASIAKAKVVKKTTSIKYVCPVCGAIVRATKAVNIQCADCEEMMVAE